MRACWYDQKTVEEEKADRSLWAFRFGKLDVLNPEHCDFTPLRQIILANAKVSFPWLCPAARSCI